jgi:biotin carboxyl carrier protein
MSKTENNDNFRFLNIDSSLYKTRVSRKFEEKEKYKPRDPKKIVSFIPGTVLDIMVKEGDNVKKGENLMILDAMKMQNMLKSSIAVKGDKVSKGTLLLELE